MPNELIKAVKSTIQLTTYQERGDGYKIPTPILAKALRVKIDQADFTPLVLIDSVDLQDMGEALIELGNELNRITNERMVTVNLRACEK